MNNKPKVSIIIATHNSVETIEECIDSIFRLSFSEIEVIAVDVNSTDGTKDLLFDMAAEDERIVFLADSIGSMGHAKNVGLDHARAPYVVFADPKGYFYKDAIGFMYRGLKESSDANMFSCETDCFGAGSYGRTNGDKKASLIEANSKDKRISEIKSRLMRSWIFDNITMYKAAFLRDRGIRFYENPGYGSQDDAFLFCAMANGISSVSSDIKFSHMIDLPKDVVEDSTAFSAVCEEFRFLKEQLKKDPKQWWEMRFVYWQAYYDRNMLLYERLANKLKPTLSKRLQSDLKEAIDREEFSADHFDVRVRDEMELLMKSADEFDRYQARQIFSSVILYPNDFITDKKVL